MLATSDHANSYYAATLAERTHYPVLTGEVRADVAVVGAGFTGVSAAITLAERGHDVVIVEANRVGWGASGRNGGQLIDGFVDLEKVESRLDAGAVDIAYRMGLECRDLVLERIEKYAIECDLKFGFVDLALRQRDLDYFSSEIERKARLDYPHRMQFVPKEELSSIIGSTRRYSA